MRCSREVIVNYGKVPYIHHVFLWIRPRREEGGGALLAGGVGGGGGLRGVDRDIEAAWVQILRGISLHAIHLCAVKPSFNTGLHLSLSRSIA
jgi:hypothetical protein